MITDIVSRKSAFLSCIPSKFRYSSVSICTSVGFDEDIKVQCDVILNAWGRMRRARASRLYCNISFVKYSINTVASHYSCDTVTFGPRSEPAISYSARIFTKQVQPVVITTQQHLHVAI